MAQERRDLLPLARRANEHQQARPARATGEGQEAPGHNLEQFGRPRVEAPASAGTGAASPVAPDWPCGPVPGKVRPERVRSQLRQSN